MPESEWPVFIRQPRLRPSKEEESRFRELKQVRDRVAGDLALDPSLIAPKAALEAIASDAVEGSARLMAWQRELLGL
jgi:ribonuclease D